MLNDHPAAIFHEIKEKWAEILLPRPVKRIVGALSDASQSTAPGGLRREGTRLLEALRNQDPQVWAVANTFFNASNEKKKECRSCLTAMLLKKVKDGPEFLNRVSEEMGWRAAPLGTVLKEELTEIKDARKKRTSVFNDGGMRSAAKVPEAPIAGGASSSVPEWQTRDKEWVNVIADAHKANLVGLAFSGGGIRSATFNLGVLQALADLKLLTRVDYLSTVSGGGYVGGWLAACTKRLNGIANLQKLLATNRVHQDEDNEPRQIRYLRVFSNYLTPKVGLLSGDSLAAAAIIMRNVLLNLVVLLAVLATLLLLPRAALRGGFAARAATTNNEVFVGLVFVVLLAVAIVVIMNNMIYLDRSGEKKSPWITKQQPILWLVAGPLFGGAILGAMWQMSRFHAGKVEAISFEAAMGAGAAAYGVIWLLAIVLGLLLWWQPWTAKTQVEDDRASKPASPTTRQTPETAGATLCMPLTALPAGALAGWLYAVLSGYKICHSVRADLTFGPPLVLGIFLLTGTLQIGLMGIAFHDWRREWWGRLGGWLLLWGIVWLTIFWLALYFPDFINHNVLVKATWKAFVVKCLTPTWIVTTVGGVLAAKGDTTSGKPGELSWKDLLAKAAPYIFMVGLVCWMSWGIDWIQTRQFFEEPLSKVAGGQNGGRFLEYLAEKVANHRLSSALVGCAVVAAVMAWRVDINEFSMHLLYRNRLVRCYLGASNKRSPNRFTGFDQNDDAPLKDLRAEKGYDGPYPVFNASLNLVKGQDLAWQERKAESFVMTPIYCGYDVWLEEQDSPLLRGERQPAQRGRLEQFGYRRTEEYAFPPPRNGLNLGTAMALSGAAASPNMGFYTSAPVAFLMTLFNVRLGHWLGNPRDIEKWRRATPVFGLTYLLNELFAGTTDEAGYVHLSDGGHFENMALYEMVKRRCGLIIVCDAEADGKYEYRGLGNAIRKCRIDLGIDIDLDVTHITPPKEGKPSKKHCAVGTIHYENVDLNAPTGTIIYFKASLTGDESTDINNYQKTHNSFPHESTIDQWFSESQFEAYRKLGHHEVTTSIQVPPTDATMKTHAAEESLCTQLIFTKFGFDTSEFARPAQAEQPRSQSQ
jgi:hypothetical protein